MGKLWPTRTPNPCGPMRLLERAAILGLSAFGCCCVEPGNARLSKTFKRSNESPQMLQGFVHLTGELSVVCVPCLRYSVLPMQG